MRKPINGSISKDSRGIIYRLVICDDGSIWEMNSNQNYWHRTDDIPQDRNELDKLKADNESMATTMKANKVEINDLQTLLEARYDLIKFQASKLNEVRTVEIPALKKRIKELENCINDIDKELS